MIDDLHVHVSSLQRYAFLLCRNHSDAEDLVQESLAKAIAAAHTYQSGKSLRAWLFSILHNTFVTHRRQYARRARAATFLSATSEDGASPSDQEHVVEAQQTLRALHRLNPDQQAALILIAIEGMSYVEAAETLDVPIGTLMSRLARGREQLRRLLDGHGPHPNRLKAVR